MQYNKELQGYGNMTELEKKMNRVDLLAYKNYDKNVYALVPGIKSEMESHGSSKYPQKKRNTIGMVPDPQGSPIIGDGRGNSSSAFDVQRNLS